MWRSEDEMLEVVRLRAGRTRVRQRVLLTGVTTTLLLVCGTAFALTRGSGGGPADAEVRVAAPAGAGATSTSTPSLALEPPPFPFPTGLAPMPTMVLPPTTVPRTPPSVPATEPGPTTTTTTARGGAAAGRTPAPPCSPEDGVATVSVEQAKYVPGQPVRVSGTLRNTSGHRCGLASTSSRTEITDPSGALVFSLGMVKIVECFDPGMDCSWPADAVETGGTCWDQVDQRTQAPAPLGTYTATLSWGGPVTASASTTFQIVPDPSPATTTVPASRCP